MIPNYSDYIRRYVRRRESGAPVSPGEHHFVATYLVPKMYQIDATVPDYVNPDGGKDVLGDLVYYKDAQHHFSIEVKLGIVRLTKGEFNNGIVNTRADQWPSIFLGVGRTGIAICDWRQFRRSYVAAVKAKRTSWFPEMISEGYGPLKSVDALIPHLPESAWFPEVEVGRAADYEQRFLSALQGYRNAA